MSTCVFIARSSALAVIGLETLYTSTEAFYQHTVYTPECAVAYVDEAQHQAGQSADRADVLGATTTCTDTANRGKGGRRLQVVR